MSKCVICKGEITGHGHNAEPVKNGRCCDLCNSIEVIPARLNQSAQGEYETNGDMPRSD